MSNCFLKSSLFALTVSVVMGLWACSDDKTAGTVTDTGNTIAGVEDIRVTGVVTRVDGSVASEAVVRMARRAVIENGALRVPEHIEVTTDTAGVFAFDSALADTFQLAVIDTSASEIFYLPRTTRESGDIDSIRLEKAAVFNSVLYYEDVTDPAVPVGAHFTVSLEGTPFYQSVFAGDSFSVLIPSGDWWMEFFPGDPLIVAKLQDSGVSDSLIFRSWKLDDVKAGDSVSAGPFMWSTTTEVDSLIKEEEKEAKIVSRISGKVLCKSDKPCGGVEVALVTDLYGFNFTEGDSLEFSVATTTDSLGRWWLPVPAEVPDDSFRVEYRKVDDGKVSLAGVSRYVHKKEIENLKDTLKLGETLLRKTSGLISGVLLVVNQSDTTQSNNCMVNSVVVGIKGTTHFVRKVTCNILAVNDLPAGVQELLLYSGDTKVISTLQKEDVPLDSYVVENGVSLPEGGVQQQQWMTYTPPSPPRGPAPAK